MTSGQDRSGYGSIVICSPLHGWVVPLEEVPDPVFKQRMLGDGVAVDPVGNTLFAPCSAVITNIHAARHALTLLASDNIEVLVHLGLDSVALDGDGIEALVAVGSHVEKGQPLLQFDLDRLVVGATAAVTPIIVSGTDPFKIDVLAAGIVEPGAPLFRIMSSASAATADSAGNRIVHRSVKVALPHGIHARPAARLADIARQFSVDASFVSGERRAAASSALALLALGVKAEQSVSIEVAGENAILALDAFEALLADPAPDTEPRTIAPVSADELVPPAKTGLSGICAVPGTAIGRAFRLITAELPGEAQGNPTDIGGEQARFEAALLEARAGLGGEAAAATGTAGRVLEAQGAFLDDPSLLASARDRITGGSGAANGWREAIAASVELLLASGDQRIAERVADLRDVEARVLSSLAGKVAEQIRVPDGSIIIATELLPSQVAALNPHKVRGIALMEGGPTSHAAILAAAVGIPMVVAFGAALDPIANGTLLLLDADRGLVEIAPSKKRIAAARARGAEQQKVRGASAGEPCRSKDGVRVEIFANLGSIEDAKAAVREGAEGCGLLRTEFLFLDRADPPGEAEQQEHYQAIADTLGKRPFVIRLLDVGSDKPAPYIPLRPEENPALGLRGIRIGLAQPRLLETQLRAILSVEPPGRCEIMPPMITDLAEFDAVAQMLERISSELGHGHAVKLGAMVETPAAALIAGQLGRRAAFLSIGSNDLAQYALAMDRGNAALAAGFDGLHPAVLRLIALTCEGARENSIPVALCGGLASDRLAIPILLGLGVRELSLPPAQIPATRAAVASLSLEDCRELASGIFALESAPAVRARSARFLEEMAS